MCGRELTSPRDNEKPFTMGVVATGGYAEKKGATEKEAGLAS